MNKALRHAFLYMGPGDSFYAETSPVTMGLGLLFSATYQ
jgi:hypothetical protein